ncbi:YjeF N-terminal domain-containing protein [Cladochytrium replicatum]|nr:YjeF N-terminal domain-containing protein [Cladochytrium replicatum]
MSLAEQMGTNVRYIGQQLAQQIDIDLMNPAVGGFSIDQLMELAGLSVAQSIAKVYDRKRYANILVCAGPGNNGGDGLVAARHLKHFGYNPSVFYPKRTDKQLYMNLVTQCRNLNIPFVDGVEDAVGGSDLVLEGIFGFSFSGEIRPPFGHVIKVLKESQKPIISIDIPSGWDVEKGNATGEGLEPDMLISLTAPKVCAKYFSGKHHYLGGRFVPSDLAKKLDLNIPEYPGTDQCVRIASP